VSTYCECCNSKFSKGKGFFFIPISLAHLCINSSQIQPLCNLITPHENSRTHWPKRFCDFIPSQQLITTSLSSCFVGGVLCSKSADNDFPLTASPQWLPEMLLVSLLPHYNPLCVLCECLMMIMQMCHRRAAWVIITAEKEAF